MSRPRTPIAERLWAKVDRSGGPDACWPWTGWVDPQGYAELRSGGGRSKKRPAHRVGYEAMRGPIPGGLTIDHLCRNRRCCNPAHLEPVTQRVNTLRGDSPWVQRSRQQHCVNGHPFDVENTHYRPNGTRQCRACGAARARAAYHERSAAA